MSREPSLLQPAIRLEVGEQVERYMVEALVNAGGMATVYRAHHVELRTTHALKVPHNQAEQTRMRLVQEGRAQAHLVHPNILRVTDVITLRGGEGIGLVADFVDGPDMDNWLYTKPPLSARLSAFEAVLDAVEYAHNHGFLHRDLKPSNVLMGPGDRVRVADFGLTKVMVESLRLIDTATAASMGTIRYSAPEQFATARDADERADVWSLGCILYELACARAPFEGASGQEILRRHMNGDLIDPELHVAGLPSGVLSAIRGAIVIERDDRLPSVDALRKVLHGEAAGPALAPSRTILPLPAPLPVSGATIADSLLDEPFPGLPKVTPAPSPGGGVPDTLTMPPARVAAPPEGNVPPVEDPAPSGTQRRAIQIGGVVALLFAVGAMAASSSSWLQSGSPDVAGNPDAALVAKSTEGATSASSDTPTTSADAAAVGDGRQGPGRDGRSPESVASGGSMAAAGPVVVTGSEGAGGVSQSAKAARSGGTNTEPAAPAVGKAEPAGGVPLPQGATAASSTSGGASLRVELQGLSVPPTSVSLTSRCGGKVTLSAQGGAWVATGFDACAQGGRVTFQLADAAPIGLVGALEQGPNTFSCRFGSTTVKCDRSTP